MFQYAISGLLLLACAPAALASGFTCSHLPSDPYHMGGDLEFSAATRGFSFQLGHSRADTYDGLTCSIAATSPYVLSCAGHDAARGRSVELNATLTRSATLSVNPDGSVTSTDENYVRVTYHYVSDDRRDVGGLGAQYPIANCSAD